MATKSGRVASANACRDGDEREDSRLVRAASWPPISQGRSTMILVYARRRQ